ncbi:MAG: hypothetical protein OHK0013_49820 [Sandaracinaceae bacterium]
MSAEKKPRKGSGRLATSRPATRPTRPLAVRSAGGERALATELGAWIEEARKQVAATANAALTTLYWRIGYRIVQMPPSCAADR